MARRSGFTLSSVPSLDPPLAQLPGHVFFCAVFFCVNFAPRGALSGSGPHVSAHVCVRVGKRGATWEALMRSAAVGTAT